MNEHLKIMKDGIEIYLQLLLAIFCFSLFIAFTITALTSLLQLETEITILMPRVWGIVYFSILTIIIIYYLGKTKKEFTIKQKAEVKE